eukprot:CAMPEP_0119050078 /NCGR_PEP_ID=MMETSP1177-20130426/68072_1 /TAXON_ID=2985 /ORGANISM="Ochromonas sp, Strain CCMP1899" /LENGTH=726 /DNA_ID=CAMNT_0007028065 /DNA_START=291 /DNA_END=2471 /DNA_ORIENTATION=-
MNYKGLFKELYLLKNMWKSRTIEEEESNNCIVNSLQAGDKNKISVYARFSPKRLQLNDIVDENNENVNGSNDQEVTLPLYQRLAMIKLSHNLKGNRQALKVLASEGGWFQSKWADIKNRDVPEENQDSAVKSNRGEVFDTGNSSQERRVPTFTLKSGAQLEKITAAVQNVDPGTGRVVMIAPDVGLREFSFDGVFPERASQKTLYDTVARRLVGDFINGYNATAIVYGQTGAGKTYSMFGKDEFDVLSGEESMRGVVPRACEEILTAMETRRGSFGIESSIGVSYVEVFGDQVSDLLKHGARCGQSKVASQRYVLLGAAERPINSMVDVAETLRVGANQKRRAATAMNDKSSRAHSLFILTLQQRCVRTNVQRTSRLFLADLGGSEQVKKSKVGGAVKKSKGEEGEEGQEETSTGFEMGDRMREAVYINLGLLALKKCIEALNNRALYTPYQDSKLTMLLSSGLGGDSKTSFIVCGCMDPSHASETVASLRFGEKCAMIEMEARNNANMLAGVLANIDIQIKQLEVTIKEKERWESKDVERVDTYFEENTVESAAGGREVKKVFMLVGAERERNDLEKLLHRRAEFTGQPLDGSESPRGPSSRTPASTSSYNHTLDTSDTGNSKNSGPTTLAEARADGRKVKKVVGFGKDAETYGLGQKYDESAESNADNSRFDAATEEGELPDVIRARGAKQWLTEKETEMDQKALEEKAKKAKRNKLMYSGISY